MHVGGLYHCGGSAANYFRSSHLISGDASVVAFAGSNGDVVASSDDGFIGLKGTVGVNADAVALTYIDFNLTVLIDGQSIAGVHRKVEIACGLINLQSIANAGADEGAIAIGHDRPEAGGILTTD